MKVISIKNLKKKEIEIFNSLDEIIKNSYNPYSKFYVASAVVTEENNVFYGVNIEICAYSSICAERIAIGNPVTNGFYKFKSIFVLAKSDFYEVKILSAPCGICRQVIYEFYELTKKDIKILVADSSLKKILITSIKEIFPKSFGPRLCGGDYKKYLKKNKRG
jgi:cytidine deaminase